MSFDNNNTILPLIFAAVAAVFAVLFFNHLIPGCTIGGSMYLSGYCTFAAVAMGTLALGNLIRKRTFIVKPPTVAN